MLTIGQITAKNWKNKSIIDTDAKTLEILWYTIKSSKESNTIQRTEP
jgi:NRPS condensation-like uncharacterized protein